jgi:aldose 1-epimerase
MLPSDQVFGLTSEGIEVPLLCMGTALGRRACVTPWGARLTRLQAPDRDGRLGDVVLGHDTLQPYLSDPAYMGCTVGRFANRIAGARFVLDGQTFTLSANDGPNALHGGRHGFNRKLWEHRLCENAVEFTLRSADGDEGYPGNMTATVVYGMEDDALRIHVQATCDRATVVNLVNHAYFNLSGDATVDEHVVTIHADRVTVMGAGNVPTGEIVDVAGTACDFRAPRAIGEAGRIFDQNFVLRPSADVRLAAEVADPRSGRHLQVWTDRPALQFYTGQFLDGTRVGHGGLVHAPFSGFCLEAQAFPDAPNHAHFPSTVLRPNECLQFTTIYRFFTA